MEISKLDKYYFEFSFPDQTDIIFAFVLWFDAGWMPDAQKKPL